MEDGDLARWLHYHLHRSILHSILLNKNVTADCNTTCVVTVVVGNPWAKRQERQSSPQSSQASVGGIRARTESATLAASKMAVRFAGGNTNTNLCLNFVTLEKKKKKAENRNIHRMKKRNFNN